MRIALLGTRGIPANYGGFETFAEELSARLVKRGHQVTVYCRSHYAMEGLSEFRGAQLVVLPTIRTKHLDTRFIRRCRACTWDARSGRSDLLQRTSHHGGVHVLPRRRLGRRVSDRGYATAWNEYYRKKWARRSGLVPF